MKVLFIGKIARVQLPLEHILAMLKGNKKWHEQHLKDGTYDCIYNFVDGGGIGIANVDSPEAAYDLSTDYPGRNLFDWEVYPLVDAEHAIDKSISRLEKAIEKQKQRGHKE
jgi:hypothetical protein